MLTKNQKIELEIDGVSAEGSGVGHYDGLAIFVPGAALGDRAEVLIIKVKKNYAFGKVISIKNESPDRIEADCTVFSQCGGCCFRHISYDAELKIKEQRVKDAFLRLGHIDAPLDKIIGSKEIDGYRNKAQYPVGLFKDADNNKHMQIGFYALNSHRIVECKSCKLQPAIFEVVLNIVETWAKQYDVTAYNETTHTGLLRHIYIRKGYFTNELMLCLIVNGDSVPHPQNLIKSLTEKVPEFKTLVLNRNKEDTNVIIGSSCKTLYGDGFITDKLCSCTFRISPLSFYQVNSVQAEILYKKAAEYAELDSSDTLLDLYCGTGTIGLTMAKDISKLYGVEIIPEAIEDAKLNAKTNKIENAEFICGDAAAAAEKLRKDGVAPSVVLVDPPRKGLTDELIGTINEMSPKRVVYVSCDPATLARDCAVFKTFGYEVRKATPVDMFPRTGHVETVVLLGRENVDEVQYAYIDHVTKDAEYLQGIKGSATYKEIKDWIKREYDMNVTNLYIGQIKDKCGFAKRDNYNIGSERGKVSTCPPEKEQVILGAFKHFEIM